MRLLRRSRRLILLLLTLYVVFCAVAGIFVADGALRPARRPLTPEAEVLMRRVAAGWEATLQDVSITTARGVTLRAWKLEPHPSNGNAAILLHGVADNRLGMTGYAQLLLAHGYTVLMPDARAHGISGGELATYGLLERYDIRQWFDWLTAQDHPSCVFGFGESMGASQLLQSLDAPARFCAVIAESPFSSFREISYDRMGQPFHLGPWLGRTILRPLVEVAFLRAHWKYKLNMEEISPENSVASATIPVFLIHGQSDINIPIRHSRRIHHRTPNTVLWEVPQAHHCGAISVAPKEFEQRVMTFLSAHSENVARSLETRNQ